MRILVAPDKFKDSLGAEEAAASIAAGLREILPEAEIAISPMADGGEGTARAICAAADGQWHECQVHDPLQRMVSARYGMIGKRAVMEMSTASGLGRLAPNERDPARASTFGTGELLLEAARRGAEEVVIGLGGSATNDGGFGLARALGFKFFAQSNRELAGPVTDLMRLSRIDQPSGLRLPPITGAVDVQNHLLGKNGATHVYGPQKGARAEQIELLEQALTRLAEIARRDLGGDFTRVPGAGAAGGLGFGLMTFAGARLRPGFEVVAEAVDLRRQIAAADIVVTGEGRLDAQTRAGKAPAGVARLAKECGKAVFAIVGSASEDGRDLFDQVLTLMQPPLSKADAMEDAANLLRERARELGRFLLRQF